MYQQCEHTLKMKIQFRLSKIKSHKNISKICRLFLKNVFAMNKKIGPPTFFMSFTISTNNWPTLQQH
jgi:hypothetical protein